MESRLFPTQALLRRAKQLRYQVRKPTLLKLVQDGYVDHAKRPGQGQGKGRAGLWTAASLLQFSTWCRLRRAGLRDDRLAFGMWWETGVLTSEVRNFLHRILRLVEVMLAEAVYRGHRPRSAKEAKALVQHYAARTGPPDILPIADTFGEHAVKTEFSILAGLLGLFEVNQPLGATVQKLAPLWEEVSSLPPPQSMQSMIETIRPHLKTLASLMYSLAPHYALSKVHKAIDETTDEELRETRVYLRQAAATALRVRDMRAYYRRIWKFLAAASEIFRLGGFRGPRVPRRTRRFQDAWTWEGLLALATFMLLRVRQAMREIDAGQLTSVSRSGKTRVG